MEASEPSPVDEKLPNNELKQHPEDEVKHTKLNGEHTVPEQIYSSDNEDSCSSDSSVSSHSLVIDQNDPTLKPTEPISPNSTQVDNIEHKKIGKRKLSKCEEEPPDIKRQLLSHDDNSSSDKGLGDSTEDNKILSSPQHEDVEDNSNKYSSGSSSPSESKPNDEKEDGSVAYSLDKPDSDSMHTESDDIDDYWDESTENENPAPGDDTLHDGYDRSPIKEYAGYLGLKPTDRYRCCDTNFDTLPDFEKHKDTCNGHEKNSPEASSQTKEEENEKEMVVENEYKREERSVGGETKENSKSLVNDIDKCNETPNKAPNEEPPPSIAYKEPIKENVAAPQIKDKKKVFLCSACRTYYAEWNLFLHMREVHNRHLCLYCLGMFPSAEKLTMHLEIKHDLNQIHFESQSKLLRSSREACYLMCCTCEHLFTEQDDFADHNCNEFMKPCTLCGEKGRHTNDCKASKNRSSKHKDRSKRKAKSNANKHANAGSEVVSIADKRTEPPLSVDLNQNSEQIKIADKYPNGVRNSPVDLIREKQSHRQSPILNNNLQESKENDPGQMIPDRLSNLENNLETPSNVNNLDNSSVSDLSGNDNNNSSHEAESSSNTLNTSDTTSSHNKSTDSRTSSDGKDAEDNKHPDETTANARSRSSPYSNDYNTPGPSNTDYDHHAGPPLLVPKLKVKIPVNYQSPVESEQSSTESDSESERVDEGGEDSNDEGTKEVGRDEMEHNEENIINRVKELEREIRLKKEEIKNARENKLYDDLERCQQSEAEDNHETEDEKDTCDENMSPHRNGHEDPNENSDQLSSNVEQMQASKDPENSAAPEAEMRQDTNLEAKSDKELFNQNASIKNGQEPLKSNEHSLKSEDHSMNSDDFVHNGISDFYRQDSSNQPQPMDIENSNHVPAEIIPTVPEDGITVANEDAQLFDLLLKSPLDKIEMVDFLRICLRSSYPYCLYCNHVRHIAVNSNSLILHLIAMHRFAATVDSITAEELQPATILGKLKAFLSQDEIYFNLESYSSENKENFVPYERVFECFRCRFITRIHKELYLHNRKMHLKNAVFCLMCKTSFYSYSELICHMCPGQPNKCTIFDIKYRCCLCDIDQLPSPFRLMVHLRKKHFACDVCLENCHDQSRLSSHVWKHKLHHLCYRCGISYRNKPDITKHLFWKHGTESVLCKRCLQKRWPHVYHFCIPPISFVCDVCNLSFSKAMALKIHKRLHTGDMPHACTEENCEKKFISKKLLLKHIARHNEVAEEKPPISEDIKPDVVDENADVKEDEAQNDVGTEPQAEDNKEVDAETPATETTKQKRKKAKRDSKENIDDIMDLPAPNLSESDSSDDSDSERPRSKSFKTDIPNVMLSPLSDNGNENDDANTGRIMDIWENFKTFQARQPKNVDDDEDTESVPMPSILHVSQSDHDYCMMYKPISKMNSSNDEDKVDDFEESKADLQTADDTKKKTKETPKKKQKTPRKSGSESSSSSSSSGSDSSCSCGSNCSCSSSSGSSGSSSSSEDSDSSTSEGKRRIAERRKAKQEKKNRSKNDDSKNSTSEIVDVVSTDTKPHKIDADDIILESDLETDETDTDEDFYDEHPQKLANQLLTEKRNQLMIQTSLSPSHKFDIVENSRPSTPSLPEETVKEKKVKLKKKKKERKSTKAGSAFDFKVNIPLNMSPKIDDSVSAAPVLREEMSSPTLPPPVVHPVFLEQKISSPVIPPILAQKPASIMPQYTQEGLIPTTPIPAPVPPKARLSTGSGSDADFALKRSKRRRRPNKFYGYSSDDDTIGPHPLMTGPAAFKPTPPPNLTWDKEDLPSPTKSITKTKSSTSKKTPINTPIHTPINTPPLPPIPPIIIRPTAAQLAADPSVQRPPVVEPLRVPPVPVHYIQPPPLLANNRESNDSDSSDEGRLQITATSGRKKRTANSAASKAQRQQQQPLRYQQQQQLLLQQQQQIQKQQQQKQIHQQMAQQITAPSTYVPPPTPPALLVKSNPSLEMLQYFERNHIRYPIQPPAGARPAREGESVYCYCRCPYDEVSEMIACDGENCAIEWFHFECVGIMVPPKGKWFCPECKPKYPNEIIEYENT